LKRSNRLVLLIGIFLAVVAFALVIVTLQGNNKTREPITPLTISVVIAAKDLPLGTNITADAVTTEERPLDQKPANGYFATSDVIGQTVREAVTKGELITTEILNSSGTANLTVPAGKVGIAVQVDQVSGVGTLAKTGDYVDVLALLSGDQLPVVTINPVDKTVTPVTGLNSTSVKLLLQGLQVIGTLLPPPPADTGNNAQASPGTGTTTSLNGQQQIVILAADAQQAEVIRYAQTGGSISIVLRSADDFRDPATGLPLDASKIIPATTTGVTLRSLVDNNGILVPQLVDYLAGPKPSASPGASASPGPSSSPGASTKP